MSKFSILAIALTLSFAAAAGTPPPPAAKADVGTTMPQSTQQTSRTSARKQMAACQARAKGLTGSAKQQAVQSCMRGL